jgi:hypothetical protein
MMAAFDIAAAHDISAAHGDAPPRQNRSGLNLSDPPIPPGTPPSRPDPDWPIPIEEPPSPIPVPPDLPPPIVEPPPPIVAA